VSWLARRNESSVFEALEEAVGMKLVSDLCFTNSEHGGRRVLLVNVKFALRKEKCFVIK
jgi:hypothetical protein